FSASLAANHSLRLLSAHEDATLLRLARAPGGEEQASLAERDLLVRGFALGDRRSRHVLVVSRARALLSNALPSALRPVRRSLARTRRFHMCGPIPQPLTSPSCPPRWR